jgi:hypothetical protein
MLPETLQAHPGSEMQSKGHSAIACKYLLCKEELALRNCGPGCLCNEFAPRDRQRKVS